MAVPSWPKYGRYCKGMVLRQYETIRDSMLAQAMKHRCIDCNVELVGLSDAEREAVMQHPCSSKGWAQYIICPDCGALHRPNGISVWVHPYGKMLVVDEGSHLKKIEWMGW